MKEVTVFGGIRRRFNTLVNRKGEICNEGMCWRRLICIIFERMKLELYRINRFPLLILVLVVAGLALLYFLWNPEKAFFKVATFIGVATILMYQFFFDQSARPTGIMQIDSDGIFLNTGKVTRIHFPGFAGKVDFVLTGFTDKGYVGYPIKGVIRNRGTDNRIIIRSDEGIAQYHFRIANQEEERELLALIRRWTMNGFPVESNVSN